MHSLRKPHWVFLVSSLPVLLFTLLCYGEFSIIHTLLPPASLALWKLYGLALGVLALGTALAGWLALARRQPLGLAFSVVQMLAYSLLLCMLTYHTDELLPRSIPRWMVPTDLTLIAWTFIMPTVAHAVLGLVARFTPDGQPQQVAPNLGLAVAVPGSWFIIYLVLSQAASAVRWNGAAAVIMVAVLVLSTLSFFFFLVRAVYVMTLRKSEFWAKTGLVWGIIITIVLPVLGLAVNSGLFFGGGFRSSSGIFGNFSSPWFYILAVLNGVLLCLPGPGAAPLRLLLFFGRSVLFGYTFYFFLVFLPFLPLSIPAIVLIGLGFLMLAPLLLFVVHVRQLSEDVAALRLAYSRGAVVGALVAGLATLPLVVTADYWSQRRILHQALAYVYTPDYAQAYRLDSEALAATLGIIRHHKERNWDLLTGSQQPYLSVYFNWLVLDNLMLSDQKMAELEQVFLGKVAEARPGGWVPTPSPPAEAVLQKASATSTYNAREQAWVSWVSLEVANASSAVPDGEYRSSFTLPPGCWVGDYYLTIGNREERGILAEKKAAAWVFAQIVNERQARDPGLLSYLGPDSVGLRLYPVIGSEVRRTRFQLLHKEPFTLRLDGQELALGNEQEAAAPAAPIAAAGSGPVYLSARAKKRLPLVQRRPYYHFLLDASANTDVGQLPAYQARMARLLSQPLPGGAPPRYSLVNTYTTSVPAGADWQPALRQAPRTGGFYLSGAIRRVLFEAQQSPAPTYPVIVVVTDNLQKAVLLDADFADFASAYPESEVFYVLGADEQPEAHSLRSRSRLSLPDSVASRVTPAVRAWPSAAQPRAYLPDNELAAVVPGPGQPVPTAPTGSRWLDGLGLRGYSQWQSFHPESTERNRVPFIQASFRAGIMTPATSFLALENEAQKAALIRKQEQVLAANASLDTMEDTDQRGPVETPIDGGVGLLLLAGAALAAWHLRRTAS
ncbi:hypothetical protein GCM10023185_35810 [Hymenobacter saemangeumensis]|uniref:VIT domain-containing protein n=1 Tax=Hymenobacter saemangeumensis TaxID=1084522 RepID=A0ABP8IQD2_9BACT